MQFNYRELLPEEFDGNSRIWIYQSSRRFSISDALRIEGMLKEFTAAWNSHGVAVKGYANLFFGQFIVLMADERASLVSGCSTDSSVHLVKEIEKQCGVQMFDRQMLAFLIDDKVQLLPLSQMIHGSIQGLIKPETLYFNNTVMTKNELEKDWIIPVKESWLASRISFPQIPA